MSVQQTARMDEATLPVSDGSIVLRRAVADDLSALIGLLANDAISARRGDTGAAADRPAYERAFAAIDKDPAHHLVVATDGDDVVGTLQLTLIPGLARVGATRLQIEAVRVRADHRNRGVGRAMIEWSLERAADWGAGLVQLTSDLAREDAHRFYTRIGFVPSHVGFKYEVSPTAS